MTVRMFPGYPAVFLWFALLAAVVVFSTSGCAKYNTFFNAKRLFDGAEDVREEAIRLHQDPPVPSGGQKADYEGAIRKAQKLIDEYPGHDLTDDALFLQAKAYYRLQSYRMSIRKFDLLFTNFPITPFMEEALYLQSMNYLLLGSAANSQDFLGKLAKQFPGSDFQSRTLLVSGDNAFTLENWDEAAEKYREYLGQFPDSEEWDRVGLKLGECYWELEDYQGGADILQEVVEKTTSSSIGFQAGLLRAKSLVRAGSFDLAKQLLDQLSENGGLYQAEGEILLAEAEMLIAQGLVSEALSLLDNLPEDWKTPEVTARAAAMLGPLQLERNELEEAQISFKDALMGRTLLEDEFETSRLSESLNQYLAAENSLSDAKAEKIPRLKLLQANAMLFGFDRPGEAVGLYGEAFADTAADSSVAARALYGVVKVYRDHLANPDSVAYFGNILQDRFPDSPQAFELRTSGEGNLLAFLLDRRAEEQSTRLASYSDEELAELDRLKDFTARGGGSSDPNVIQVRRRQVYLSRRPNILYPPPEAALLAARLALEKDSEETDTEANPDSKMKPGLQPDSEGIEDSTQGPTSLPNTVEVKDPQGKVTAKEGEVGDKEIEKEKEEEKKEEKKKRRRSGEFDVWEPKPSLDNQPDLEFGP
ncbi:MAG: tetratricopeptide repeat protein [Gemmatimonadales bacterium]|nr:tetratricopeptide repeat protein [Gemmatimonadales bacterium]